MRTRFALAFAVVATFVPAAGAFERHAIEPGDSLVGTILARGALDEYTLDLARGTVMRLTIAKSGAGNYRPAIALYTDDYQEIGITGVGPSTVQALPVSSSGTFRMLVAGGGTSVGGYRVSTAAAPQKKFALAATPAAPADTLTFGAYPGFSFSVSLKWKGPAPVTLKSLKGPHGADLASAQTPHSGGTSWSQGGFEVTELGDHTLVLDVPSGTLKWSATVTLAGRLPRGTTHDFRPAGIPEQPTVTFPSLGRFPIVRIAGELGGPNDCVLSVQSQTPDAVFLDGGAGTAGCSRSPIGGGDPPAAYLLYCVNGFVAHIGPVERDDDHRITGYEATDIRTPQGSGNATLSGFTYDAAGRVSGWDEVRRFDATGRVHTLEFSEIRYFPNGIVKAFHVVHTPPTGAPRTYDYAPFE